jgi:hypothetical protein
VIARAGYTSVMELVSLGKGAVLIPTPGQPEQEYLGDWLNGHHGFVTVRQNKIKTLFHADVSGSQDAGALPADTVTAVETGPAQPADSDPFFESAAARLHGSTLQGKTTTPQLPDSSDLLNQAINLLLEQKKE